MKRKFVQAFMRTAEIFADLSHARRLHVGAIVVKDDRIISIGYNGTPRGWDNNCEDIVEQHEDGGQVLKTKPEVMHAERNALDKLARSSESGVDADIFVTHAPCLECAKSIYGSGIKKIYYRTSYKSMEGLEFLKKCGVEIEQVNTTSEVIKG